MKWVIPLIVLTGCVHSQEVYTPDGTIGHSISCSGTANNWGRCYEKAGELCGAKGYAVIQRIGDQGAVVAGSSYGFSGSTVINRTIMIQCK